MTSDVRSDTPERRKNDRRQVDKKARAMIAALEKSVSDLNVAITNALEASNSSAVSAQTAAKLITDHIPACDKRDLENAARHQETKADVADIKKSLADVLPWAQAGAAKAKSQAETWARVKEAVTTDGIITVIKASAILFVLSIFYGGSQAIRKLFELGVAAAGP